MKKYLFCILFTLLASTSFSQSSSYLWANGIGNTGDDQASSIAVDVDGNTYITGQFTGTVDFDPGTGTVDLTAIGDSDIFVAKYSSTGAYIWAFNIGGAESDMGLDIQLNSNGSLIVCGFFSGINVDFDPDATSIYYLSSSGKRDFFYASFNVSGIFQWANSVGGVYQDQANALALDPLDNIYITGSFIAQYANRVDFNPGQNAADTFYLFTNSFQNSDLFVAKYSSSGDFIWAFNVANASAIERGNDISVDDSGNVVITGDYSNSTDFDPGSGTSNVLSKGGAPDIFVAKYDSSKNFKWAFGLGSVSQDGGRSVVTDSSGNVIVTGRFSANPNGTPPLPVDFDPGPGTANLFSTTVNYDAYLAKYTPGGAYLWAKNIGGNNWDEGFALNVNPFQDILITGSFEGIADFDPSSPVFNLISLGGKDVFVAEYASTGNFHWALNVGGTGVDIGYGISSDTLGVAYVCGSFSNTVDFNPTTPVVNLTSNGGVDIFLAAYTQLPVGVADISRTGESLFLYPNPSSNYINIVMPDNSITNLLTIRDLHGRIVKKSMVNNELYTMDVSGFDPGVYLITLESTDSVSHARFVVTK